MNLPTRNGVLVVFNVATPEDLWLRDMIRGEHTQAEPRTQAVIVSDVDEARRLMDRLAQVKHAKNLPYGGAWSQVAEFVW
jgi:hypothetical protein